MDQSNNHQPAPKPSNGKQAKLPVAVEWHITARNEKGDLVKEYKSHNIVVKDGRDFMLQLLFGFTPSSLIALGAGPCSTGATVDDFKLNQEHILDTSRKSLTNTSGVGLSISDIDTENFTDPITGCEFEKKLTCRGVYELSDPNNGHPFQEYGLFTTTDLPSAVDAMSGLMYNHYVSGSPIEKDSSTTITVDVTIRT